MRFSYKFAISAILALGVLPTYGQGMDPFDKYLAHENLFAIPPAHQHDVTPGTLIVMANGVPTYLHPQYGPNVKIDEDVPMMLRGRIQNNATGLNVFLKLVGVDASAVFSNTNGLIFNQTELRGRAFNDDVREDVVLQPDTPLAALFQKWQTPATHPVYVVTGVYSTAELGVSKVSNLSLSGTFNSTQSGKCTQVAAASLKGGSAAPPAGPSSGATVPAAPPQSPAPAGTSSPVAAAVATTAGATVPGGGIQVCKGTGDTVQMTSTHDVPVAMSVCYVFVAPDGSYNCGLPRRGIQF